MTSSKNFREYPAILNIEQDGTIIALDKKGRANSELHVDTITKDDEYRIFGTELYENYKRRQFSRYERNKDSYQNGNEQRQSNRPEDYYTLRDREHYLQQQEQLKKNKRQKKWLIFGIIVLAFIILVIGIKSCTNDNSDTLKSNNQTQEQSSAIEDDIHGIKDSIQNGNDNTNEQIQDLQNKVNQLEQQNGTGNEEKAVQGYQDTIDKLKNAKLDKDNGNDKAVEEKLNSVKEDVSTLKDKIETWFDELKEKVN